MSEPCGPDSVSRIAELERLVTEFESWRSDMLIQLRDEIMSVVPILDTKI